MAKLIETVTIENTQGPTNLPEAVESPIDILEYAKMPWRDYLKIQDYNKDRYKMCELCIRDQKRNNNGKTPIICTGLRDYKVALNKRYGTNKASQLIEMFSEEEKREMAALINPMDWFMYHMTDKSKARDNSWHQDLSLSCSAKNKVLRWGRRCGKTYSILIEILHSVATSDKPINILVAAPQITMIDEIVSTIADLTNNLDIPNFVISKKSQPILEMVFFNGSTLKGITAGSDGTSARGKKADILWIDEVDFVPTKALDAINAIQLDNPDVRLIYTSTPIGEGNLFNFARAPTTKEFHYPTFVKPDYTDEMHATIENLSETAYLQEVLAFYGVDDAGVFQPRYIERAYENYINEFYNDTFVLNNRERFIIIIGVDWNGDTNGTRVLVVCYDKQRGLFFVVEKRKIAKINTTQSLSVDFIVDVNRKYAADHIYCDEGYGAAQLSQLRLKGESQYGKVPPDHPDIKLVDAQGVQFASTLTIRDPVTYEQIKKQTKQYIVEYTQKQLEDNHIALHEYNDDELVMQMKNYHVKTTGVRGNIYKPKDKKIGDHDLDAFMIALYGFDKEYGGMIKPQVIEHGMVLPKDQGYDYTISGRTVGLEEVAHSTINRRIHVNSRRKAFKPRSRW